MPPLTNTERVELVYLYGANNRSLSGTARAFNERHPHRSPIYPSTVAQLIKRFERTFSVSNIKCASRKRKTTDDIAAVNIIENVERTPKISIRRLARECKTSSYAVGRVLKEHKYRPFKEKQVQILHKDDAENRLSFCRWFLGRGDVRMTLFSDEAVFYLNGSVNRPHYWAQQNPRRFEATRSHKDAKVNVWVGILGHRIFGPFFFNENITGKFRLFD